MDEEKTLLNSTMDLAFGTVNWGYLSISENTCEQVFANYTSDSEGASCPTVWDGFKCWPSVSRTTVVTQQCRGLPSDLYFPPDALAVRVCDQDGYWVDNYTDYAVCLHYIKDPLTFHDSSSNQYEYWQGEDTKYTPITAWISVMVNTVSLLLLLATLFIFTFFRALKCNRIWIHKNLVVSFILRGALTIVMFGQHLIHIYIALDWLCKALLCFLMYTIIANHYWMLVEGLFLHNRIAVTVFYTETPFKIFYTLGWGFPGLVTLSWALCQFSENKRHCWNNWYALDCSYIFLVPIIIAVVLNTGFLVNIIRILVTRLRANKTLEIDQVRKATKALVVLFPLLGLTYLIFAVKPPDGAGRLAYYVVNALLQSSQGSFVAIIYCFMNSEVHQVVRKKWRRYRSVRLDTVNRSYPRAHQSYRSSTVFTDSVHNGHTRRSHNGHDSRDDKYLESVV